VGKDEKRSGAEGMSVGGWAWQVGAGAGCVDAWMRRHVMYVVCR
jgi:hypothetical protein